MPQGAPDGDYQLIIRNLYVNSGITMLQLPDQKVAVTVVSAQSQDEQIADLQD